MGAGDAPPAGGGGATDGLGDSTAEDFGGVGTGAARGRGRRRPASDEARETEMAS